MRALFFGTPEFARPTLEALLVHHTVVGVVTQPDRPAGRGQRARPTPVKQTAAGRGLAVFQPVRLRDAGWADEFRSLAADVAVVVAFGQILPREILDLPRRGSINVHASLLPRYRGAAPVAWAIIRGERETGVTTFQMDPGLDTGPILLQRRTDIAPEETAAGLADRLAGLGAELLIETLARLDALAPRAQEEGEATLAPRLRKEDGLLDWTRPAVELAALVRGVNPWPGALTATSLRRLLVWTARAVEGVGDPGILTRTDGRLGVGTGRGLLVPVEVQPENRRVMTWDAFLRGARLVPGMRLGVAVARR